MPVSPARARALVLLVAIAAYLNSLGNDFAFDDNWFIVENEVVTEGRYGDAFTQASWPGAMEGTGNYRPIVLTSFATEWALWGPEPFGFHVLSVIAHALVSMLVLALLTTWVGPSGGLAGAVVFALHPVHVEAVANVMGRSELYAALAYLSACWLYWRWRPVGGRDHALRLLALIPLYLLAMGSKEIAVSLPAALILLEAFRRTGDLGRRLLRNVPTYVALFGLMGIFVVIRWGVLGLATGANTTPGIQNAGTTERLLTALSVWPEYVRLMVFPADLVVDYAPAVLLIQESVTPEVVAGAFVLVGLIGLALASVRRMPAVALGIAWFIVTVSPVSNLVVQSDVVLAERTLYLPSLGFVLIVAAAIEAALTQPNPLKRRWAVGCLVVWCALGLARTVDRNPSWSDSFSVMSTLAEEHPESWRAQWAIAVGQVRVGDLNGATETYRVALELAPDHYQLLVEAATHHARQGRPAEAEALFERAIDGLPGVAGAYRRQAEERLSRGEYRGAHEAVTRGWAAAGADRELFGILSETYIARSDLTAAVRAREAAIGQEPGSAHDWGRLADIRMAQGRPDLAANARAQATRLAAAEREGGGS